MAATAVTVDQLVTMAPAPLGHSAWFSIDQDRIDRFADATEDHQWIHVDPARAAEGPFGTTIAHGYLSLSLVPRLLEDVLQVTDQVRGTNYGVDRARFIRPVPTGSDVRLSGELVEAERRSDGGVQYKVRVALEVRGQDRPGLVADVIYLTYAG